MKKMENLIEMEKIKELLGKKEEKKSCNVLLWVLAVIGAVAAVAAIAYGVYRYLKPDYLEDFEDDFDDNIDIVDEDEDFFEDEGEN